MEVDEKSKGYCRQAGTWLVSARESKWKWMKNQKGIAGTCAMLARSSVRRVEVDEKSKGYCRANLMKDAVFVFGVEVDEKSKGYCRGKPSPPDELVEGGLKIKRVLRAGKGLRR